MTRQKFIYLIRVVGGGPVKIGISGSPEARIAAIQTSCPFPIEVVSLWELRQAADIERLAHKSLAGVHAHGEWFNVSAGIAAKTIVDAAATRGYTLSCLRTKRIKENLVIKY